MNEQKERPRGERARNRARVKKLQKKNCQKMKKHQQEDYPNVVPSPWEINNICRALPDTNYG